MKIHLYLDNKRRNVLIICSLLAFQILYESNSLANDITIENLVSSNNIISFDFSVFVPYHGSVLCSVPPSPH